jgi:hypothetical protein
VTGTTRHWQGVAASVRRWSPARTIVVLVALAVALRVLVFAGATAVGPDDSVSDVQYHAQLVHHPVEHLRGSLPDVRQYAPYLGFLERATAAPWLALGTSDTTALRLGAITWDVFGMLLLVVVLARRRADLALAGGLVWAIAPLLWPASAYAAQDEPIAAAFLVVALVFLLAGWRSAGIVTLVVALFAAKVLLAPVLLAVLLTGPGGRARSKESTLTALALAGAAAVTWVLSDTDGLSQQLRYHSDNVAFSMTPWSTMVLHHVVTPATANRLSIALAAVAVGAVIVTWSRTSRTSRAGGDPTIGGAQLASALLITTFALLAISNPEYLCLVVPVAIVAGAVATVQVPWGLVLAGALAWSVNVVYYLLRTAYDPTGDLLGATGFVGDLSGKVRVLDALHQGLLAALWFTMIVTAWRWAAGARDAEPLIARPWQRARVPVTPSTPTGAVTTTATAPATGRAGGVRAPRNVALPIAGAFLLASIVAGVHYTLGAGLFLAGIAVAFFVSGVLIDRSP